MKLCTAAQSRAMDLSAINEYSISGITLMEAASRRLFDAAVSRALGTVAVFCGGGNNGGDGFGAAWLLAESGIPVRVFFIGDENKMTADSAEMRRRFTSCGGMVEPFDPENSDIISYTLKSSVIIDALFGIGFSSAPRGSSRDAIELINSSSAFVIAADIPSGVDADTGLIYGEAVRADLTITFNAAKPGHFVLPGALNCGELRVADIGIPEEIMRSARYNVFAVTEDDIALPKRRADAHKGDFGRDLIIAGSVGYTGAPCLASRAAVRSGAGLVTLCVPEKIYPIIASKCAEEMPTPAASDENGLFAVGAKQKVLSLLEKADACLMGPGLGRSAAVTEMVNAVIRASKVPLVIDADGINAVAGNIDILDEASCPIILTPHDGEFLRLGGDVSEGRVQAARDFAKKHRCTLVLKGRGTVSAFPDGEAYINTTGNPGMAKGGSGDVLAGMIVSLLGQALPLKDAVTAAVYLHGKAGDMCRDALGEYFMTPSDITDGLAAVLKNATR